MKLAQTVSNSKLWYYHSWICELCYYSTKPISWNLLMMHCYILLICIMSWTLFSFMFKAVFPSVPMFYCLNFSPKFIDESKLGTIIPFQLLILSSQWQAVCFHFACTLIETAHVQFVQGGVSTCGICNLFTVRFQRIGVPSKENVCRSRFFQIWKVTILFLVPLKLHL
jgi:hypothetical protein